MPKLVKTVAELRSSILEARNSKGGQQKIALVPTMGALHEGHLALVEESRRVLDNVYVVVTIFVNPRQFAVDGADLEKYPRTLEKDMELLKDKADLVFVPSVQEVYPPNMGNEVIVTAGPASAARFEGSKRVGHFDGVLTVVAKLFNMVQADDAFFGQKDAEQVFLIKRMVQQLNFPIRVHTVPTKRHSTSLALSSRNQHLSEEEWEIGLRIPKALFLAKKLGEEKGAKPSECSEKVMEVLEVSNDLFRLDYLHLVKEDTLGSIDDDFKGQALMLAAAWVGKTRLIDNVRIEFK